MRVIVISVEGPADAQKTQADYPHLVVLADEKHGLTLPLRKAVYAFFERWLNGRDVGTEMDEIAVEPRATKDLLVCPEGQANLGLKSRHLLGYIREEYSFRKRREEVPIKVFLRPYRGPRMRTRAPTPPHRPPLHPPTGAT